MTPKDEKTYLIEKGDVISSDETFFGNAWSNLICRLLNIVAQKFKTLILS